MASAGRLLPWFGLALLVALLSPLPGVLADASTEGSLRAADAVQVEGDVSWAAGDGSLVHIPAASATIILRGEGVKVHAWRWNTTHVDTPWVRGNTPDDRQSFEWTTTRFENVTFASGPDAHLGLALRAGTVSTKADEATLQRAQEAVLCVDDRWRARTPRSEVPYYHFERDVAWIDHAGPSALNATGAMQVSLWDTEVTAQTDDGPRTWRAGQWRDLDLVPGSASFDVRQVVWLEVANATLQVHTEEGMIAYVEPDGVGVAGVVDFPRASGQVSVGTTQAGIRDERVALRGDVMLDSQRGAGTRTITVHQWDRAAPYAHSSWRVQGETSTVMIGNTLVTTNSPIARAEGAAAVGIGALLAALAAYRFGPALLAAIRPNNGDTRRAVYNAIRAHPGVQARDVADLVDISLSTAKYHLRRLVSDEHILIQDQFKPYRYCVNLAAEADEPIIISLLQSGTTSRVVDAILHNPGMGQKQLSIQTGLPRSTVSFHLRRLVESGAVRSEQQGDRNMNAYHPTKRLQEALSRLHQSDPATLSALSAIEA